MANVKNNKGSNESSVNLLDLFMYLLGHWPWFLLSVAVCVALAGYKYAKTPFTYYRQATVMIKDPSNNGLAAGFGKYNSLINNVNVSNEILQFRSTKLLSEVIQRTNANVSYQIKLRGLRDTELYKTSPFIATFPDATPQSYLSFFGKMLDANTVEVSNIYGNAEAAPIVVNVNDTVLLGDVRTVFSQSMFFVDSWIGKSIKVTLQPVNNLVGYYKGRIGISQSQSDASFLTLAMTDQNPSRAEVILNTLIDVYNEQAIEDKNMKSINTEEFIRERLVIIEQELGDVEGELESYKRTNEMYSVSASAGRNQNEMEQAFSEIKELETQMELMRFIRDYLNDPSKESELIPSGIGITTGNIESLIAQYNNGKIRRDKLLEESSERSPVVQELSNSLLAMRESIVAAINQQIANLTIRRNNADARQHAASQKMNTMPQHEREMLSIERQQKIKESLYIFLLNRREENALAQTLVENNARVIDPAMGSDVHIAPDRNKMLLLGALMGVVIPLAILLLRIFLDTKVHGRKDITEATTIPFVGTIPLKKSHKKAKEKTEGLTDIVISDHGRDVLSEAFRIVRTNLTFMTQKMDHTPVITFTSFNESAGKTFVASNLAMSLVNAKKKVVIVDLDIRKGTISGKRHKHKPGVTNYLADNNVTVDEIIRPYIDGADLDIVSSGLKAPNPTELLMDPRLDELMEELKKRYDYVIADNVPVGIIADADVVNRVADLTVFVGRANRLDKRQLPELEELYQKKKLTNMCILLNGTEGKHHGYGYGYGYGYGDDSDEDGEKKHHHHHHHHHSKSSTQDAISDDQNNAKV